MSSKITAFLVARSHKRYSGPYRAFATVLGAALFIAGWPALVWLSGKILPGGLIPSPYHGGLAGLNFLIGIPWMLWAVAWQLWKGKGTPVPVVPTKHFLKNGPYRYVRNPMMLGHFLYTLGWAFLFNALGGYLFAALLITGLVLEIKLIEEKELERRFGGPYRAYKQDTPFILPRIKR